MNLWRAVALLGIVFILTFIPSANAFAQTEAASGRMKQFEGAAKEFGVPAEILLAISYQESRWQPRDDRPSINGGYGLTNLRLAEKPAEDARGDGKLSVKQTVSNQIEPTLSEASKLVNQPADILKKDDLQNLRGAAALLASYARQLHSGTTPSDVKEWYGAVAKFSGSKDETSANAFADEVYSMIQKGVGPTDINGQVMKLQGQPGMSPDRSAAPASKKHGNTNGTECPRQLDCRFEPAAYTQNDPNNPEDWGSYSKLNEKRKITQIVIHNTEGSYQSAIDHFKDPTRYVSAHYVIRSSDGQVTQMVKNNDVSWAAGDWYVNGNAINIEHEGFAAQGASWYTDEMYRSSAKLVRYLAEKYDIPLDRQHIIGHDSVPSLSYNGIKGQHWDPGPFWDWEKYMKLAGVHDDHDTTVGKYSKSVTISPQFDKNKMQLNDCTTTKGTCVPMATQSTNRVYLHTEPKADAPLLSDKYLQPGGEPGTLNIEDWSASAVSGQQFAVADVKDDWTGVWFGGKVGWFHNPKGKDQVAYTDWKASLASPKEGKLSVPLYGAAYPETSAYPAGVTPQTLVPIYEMPAGQKYVVTKHIPTNYLYSWTINSTVPNDNVFIKGNDKFYQIDYNHRVFYVRVGDVDIK